MQDLKKFLLWEGIPFLLLLFVFGFIATINWDYESKLISLDNSSSDWVGVHMGPILLATAAGQVLIASFLLFLVRVIFRPKRNIDWVMVFPLVLIAVLFIFPSLFIVILGPASITMMEQMRVAPK
jgi:hypothetical protein